MKTENIAIICARAGSVRVPKKNIRDFDGQNIVQKAVETSLKSQIFSQIIVSTDSDQLLEILDRSHSRYTNVYLHKRPTELGAGDVFVRDVVLECLNDKTIQDNVRIWVLFPTCPLRKPETLVSAAQTVAGLHQDEQLVSVSRLPIPWQLTLNLENKYLRPNHENIYKQSTRHNDYPQSYFANFVFVVTNKDILLNNTTLIGEKAIPFETNAIESIDIDDENDWALAQLLAGVKS